MKITMEMDDNLQEFVDEAIERVKEELISHLEQNECDEVPDLGNDLDYSGAIHEIIDSAVPIHTKEINDIMYLHGDEVEHAFDDAGIGNKDDKGWPAGWKAAAIYCYIESKVHEWYRNESEDVFNEWKESHKNKNEFGPEEVK